MIAAWLHPLGEHVVGAAGRWVPDPGPLAATVALAGAYVGGVRRLWARAGQGRGVRVGQTWAFAGAVVALLAALASPFDAVADALFSAHMIQHLVLILVAAPLLVLGNVTVALAWAPPLAVRRGVARWWNGAAGTPRVVRGAAHVVATPAAAWVLHAAALVAWHVPALYQAALVHPAAHALEHVSFLATAYLFWWRVAQPAGRRALGDVAAIPYVMSMGVLGAAMGALLTFSRSPWYPLHGAGARAWHTTLLADQQLAGLVMWVPAGLVYLAAALAVAARWMLADGRRAEALTFGEPRTARAVGAAGAAAMLLLVAGACARGGQRDTPERGSGSGGSAATTARTQDGALGDRAPIEGGAHLAADPARGARAIRTYGCGSCHSIPGVRGADGMVGPPLTAWSQRTVIAGYVPNTPEQLVHWIVMPQSVAPGNAMPNLGVTDGDARDIAAYLYSLR